MKKLVYIILAALLVSGSVLAQDQQPEKKKKGGFMKALKKGVESSTGLRVSDEALFVYPVIGEWKMQLESCTGNRATGEVRIKISITKLSGGRYGSTSSPLKEARITGGDLLAIDSYSAEPLNEYEVGKPPVEVTFAPIVGVPADAKTLDIKFYINANDFEARRIPIEWVD